MNFSSYFDVSGLWLIRLLFQRGLAAVYLVAFFSALNQFRALLGEKGLLPVPQFLKNASFNQAPSIFHWYYSDNFFLAVAGAGIVLSLLAFLGLSERGPWWLSLVVWLALYLLYLSIVNVGQTFYSFGWESMLLEAGFFAVFLGSAQLTPSAIPLLALRWMLFRVELGAGLIKLRGDQCWRDLTCLYYHYETQPMPNPASWYFHHFPPAVQRLSVLFSHFVQLVMPFGLFLAQPLATIAAIFIIFHQLLLIVSGNYSWLNWLTIVLALTALSGTLLARLVPLSSAPALLARPAALNIMLYGLAALTLVLSIKPALNFFSRQQLMNFDYNPLHLVGSYGAFGSVTKERYEVVVEGTADSVITPHTAWQEYQFKSKPGGLYQRPGQWAPYHLRLDWLMWFLPFSVQVTRSGLTMYGHETWFIHFIQKLLNGDAPTLGLLGNNPFKDVPPRFVRAQFYRYQFTDAAEKKSTGAWWKRTLVGQYLPPVTAAELAPY